MQRVFVVQRGESDVLTVCLLSDIIICRTSCVFTVGPSWLRGSVPYCRAFGHHHRQTGSEVLWHEVC